MVSVAISHGINTIQTLEDSLKKLGGIHQIIQEDQIVFIKPDLTLPLGQPITIQPQVLGYLVKLCRDVGAKRVYIGFNPFDGVSSKQVLKLLGLDYYLEELGGTPLYLEDEKFSQIKISNPFHFNTLSIPEKLLESEVFISIVAPRTDIYGNYSLGLKNYFDLLNDEQKQHLIQTGSLQGLLDYYKIKLPQLTIWDAMTVGKGQGPFNQKPVRYNLILASTDLIAGDSIMSQLMGITPHQIDVLKIAAENQLGIIDSEKITILGKKLVEHQKNIKVPVVSSKSLCEDLAIVEGKPCSGCQICLRYVVDFLLRFIKKDLKEFGGFTFFIGKKPSNLSYTLKTGVVLFGNCAISSNYPIKFTNKTQKKKYFYKFTGCPPLNLHQIEKFCLNFKEWLPSLEIIEEFIRKWTVGRRYKPIPTS